ncbi:MAG: HEPN domain-containing protein [Methanophagales archaeon]|nr:HEPN domain-containing protein [Methanophagales archaeon]
MLSEEEVKKINKKGGGALVNSNISNHEKALLVAKAYPIEAHSDFESVDTLIECSKYNLAVYHAQQAVEKNKRMETP